MRADLAERLPLVCLACRSRSGETRNYHAVAIEKVLRVDAGEIEEAVLRCTNEACRRRYPVIDGIPILMPDPAAFLQRELVGVIERDLAPETAELLAQAGPDDAPYARLLETLSIYLDTHWGEHASPSLEAGMGEIAARLAGRSSAPVALAVELGSSVGRGAFELAKGADLTVGIDTNLAALRRARRLLGGEPLAYARRAISRHYHRALISPPEAEGAVALVCADALDPPLVPGIAGRVAALNLIDVVLRPLQLLSVVDGLCRPGGEAILCSPYAFASSHVAEGHRFGDDDPAGDLARRMNEGRELESRYTIEDEAELRWSLRRDARSAVVYTAHWLRARKALA